MSEGYPYDDRPSKQEVRDALIRYKDAYGRPAAVEFMGYLGFKNLAEIPGESYQYVIDCLDAEMDQKGEDFVAPASPLPSPTLSAKEAQRRENRRRWKEEADRDRNEDDRYLYAKLTTPTVKLTFPRTPGWRDEQDREALKLWRAQRREERATKKAAEKTEAPKGWVQQRFGVLDV